MSQLSAEEKQKIEDERNAVYNDTVNSLMKNSFPIKTTHHSDNLKLAYRLVKDRMDKLVILSGHIRTVHESEHGEYVERHQISKENGKLIYEGLWSDFFETLHYSNFDRIQMCGITPPMVMIMLPSRWVIAFHEKDWRKNFVEWLFIMEKKNDDPEQKSPSPDPSKECQDFKNKLE